MRDRGLVVVFKCLPRNENYQDRSVFRPNLVCVDKKFEKSGPMFAISARIKGAPLLSIKRRWSPAGSFKESHQFVIRDFLSRHGAWRPAINQQRFNRKVCFANLTSFYHMVERSLVAYVLRPSG